MKYRFIPVYTGNTRKWRWFHETWTVYPCVYREHISTWRSLNPSTGLSLCIQGTRIISYGLTISLSVYPCAYRERINFSLSQIKYIGLSLCIQGTPTLLLATQTTRRFIPVHTGNAPIITYCFIIKILPIKFLPIF